MTALQNPADAKREFTAIATGAHAGIVVTPTTDDRERRVYVVSKWALTKQLDSLEALEAWLDRVTGKTA